MQLSTVGVLPFYCSLLILPSRELTYPTWGKGKSSSNMPYQGDMLISWRVIALFQFPNVNCIIACVNCRGLLAGSHALCAAHVQQQAAVNIHTPEHALVFFVIIFVFKYIYIYMDTYDFTIYHTWFCTYTSHMVPCVSNGCFEHRQLQPTIRTFCLQTFPKGSIGIHDPSPRHGKLVHSECCDLSSSIFRSTPWKIDVLQITQLERNIIFQTSMIMFHVNLQGCSCSLGFGGRCVEENLVWSQPGRIRIMTNKKQPPCPMAYKMLNSIPYNGWFDVTAFKFVLGHHPINKVPVCGHFINTLGL